MLEPLSVASVCAWLAFNNMGEAAENGGVAAIFGALLASSFVVAVAALAAGLAWDGPWRELPTSVSWPVLQVRGARCWAGHGSGERRRLLPSAASRSCV